jgi:ribonuclease HII
MRQGVVVWQDRVVAAAVILPADFNCPLLNDSKQLTELQREKLRPIIEKEALAWGVAEVSCTEIDEINILNASILAMHRAVDKLTIRPEFIIVDGNKFKSYQDIPHQTIVKGIVNISLLPLLPFWQKHIGTN